MGALGAADSFDELQEIVERIYGLSNDRWFDIADMATNVSRFTMRAVKAVRRGQIERVEKNLAVSLSWFVSSANRLHLRLSDVTWRRFPYRCATCGACPCLCPGSVTAPSRPTRTAIARPRSIADAQRMFADIYPPDKRSLEHAAIHLVEEMGEYQEAILMYRMRHRAVDLRQVETEAADYLSCLLGVYASIDHEYATKDGAARAMADLFTHNCHECGRAPCVCSFDSVMNYNLNDKW